jgi:AcrR family transcriptional regulator
MSGRGAYAKGVAKREEILRTALEVFSREGYRGTSLREVARASGLSLPGLMHYFSSKEDLLAEILKKRDERDAATSLRPDNPLAALAAIMRHNAEVPGLVQLYATLSAAASNPEHPAHDFFVERYTSLRTQFADDIRRRQAEGTLAVSLDPDKLAATMIALADGIQVQWMLDPSLDMGDHIDFLWSTLTAQAGA